MTWYKDGLHFKCTQCGACCTGSPGYVWVTDEECARMAEKLDVQLSTFLKHFTRMVKGRRSLLECPTSYDCIFLKEGKCQLYDARPKQCRTFPWWKDNLSSPGAWQEAAAHCEGIDHPDAPLTTFSEIQKQLES